MNVSGRLFNLEKYHIHDGGGIRTALFFKGCNLRCPWCSNPESQESHPQLIVHRNLCRGCMLCKRSCPSQAISLQDGCAWSDPEKCRQCGGCVNRCPYSARQLFGQTSTVAEMMAELKKDAPYYSRSGGGVTLTGGEPLLQGEFARELSLACRAEYFPVAMETAGFVPWENAWRAWEFVDEVLLDIKTTDKHKLPLLGAQMMPDMMLATLRENISGLKTKRKSVVFRCPIIPGFNNNEEHLHAVLLWASEFDIGRIDLLPFHQFGRHKYVSLGLDYRYPDTPSMRDEELAWMETLVKRAGFVCTVGG